MTWREEARAEGTGLGRSVGCAWNLMVSEGIRPHQGSTVIHGHLVSTDKPNILLWKLLLRSSVKLFQERKLHLTCQVSVLGHDFRVLFYFVSART